MRWDSPFVLAVAGTLAFHLLAITAADALIVTRPPQLPEAPPHVELVEVEVPPVLQPPPPPVPAPEPAPAVEPEVKPVPRPRAPRPATPEVRTPDPSPPPTEAVVPSGGEQVVQMDDPTPSATGVGVAVGKRSTGRIGRGGTGGGTAAGSGAGSADELARPVSIATIKTNALPKGDYQFDASRDYPSEARALGIEGDIRVRLVVDQHGKVTSRRLLNSLGHGLDELAMKRVAEFEFEPAKDTDDRPVSSVVVWTFHMTLPK